MLQLLYTVIMAQMSIILTLLFKTPLRKLVILTLDKTKRGRGPVAIKTIAATVFVVLMSNVHSMVQIQHRTDESGVPTPTDQVFMATNMLEASLMGFLLFLALMIDRIHNYIRELRTLRKAMEAAKKQSRSYEDLKNGSSGEAKALKEEVATLKAKIREQATECEAKSIEEKVAETEDRLGNANYISSYHDLVNESCSSNRRTLHPIF